MKYYLAKWTDPRGGVVDLAVLYEKSLEAAEEVASIAEGEPCDPSLKLEVVPLAAIPTKELEGFDLERAKREAREETIYFLLMCGVAIEEV